jgi:hypothetical protein
LSILQCECRRNSDDIRNVRQVAFSFVQSNRINKFSVNKKRRIFLAWIIPIAQPKANNEKCRSYCTGSLQWPKAGVFNAWPAELFAVARRPFWKNNYKRDEIKSNFNNARWPLSYTAVFWIVRSFLNLQRTLCISYFTNI